MMRAYVRVIDIETTGISPEPDHGVCEIGWCDVVNLGGGWEVDEPGSILLNPGRPIPPEMSAIHHLIEEDVAHAPPWRMAVSNIMRRGDTPAALCAHNAAFERQFLTDDTTGGLPWICTMKVAYRMWKGAPSFSNQALRYWRKPAGLERGPAHPSHRAGPDAYVTAFHLRDMLNHPGVQIEHLIKVSNRPSLLPRVMFGKHKGSAWTAVPREYLQWMVGQADMNADAKFTAQHYLNQGRAA